MKFFEQIDKFIDALCRAILAPLNIFKCVFAADAYDAKTFKTYISDKASAYDDMLSGILGVKVDSKKTNKKTVYNENDFPKYTPAFIPDNPDDIWPDD